MMIATSKHKRILLFSLLLNTLLFFALFFTAYLRPFTGSCDFKTVKEELFVFRTNLDEYAKLSKLNSVDLIKKLDDQTLLEQGYTIADLALSVLASRNMDIERALNRRVSKRRLVLQEGKSLTLYPGLTKIDLRKVKSFFNEEKWPLTTKGLFVMLKKRGVSDAGLVDAFKKRIEFQLVQRLFSKVQPSLSDEIILQLITEGGFERLKGYTDGQKERLDLSENRRRAFLLEYIKCGSKTAAALLLRCDFRYSFLNLDDDSIIQLLKTLPKKKLSYAFAKRMLRSARSDKVLQAANEFLGDKEVAIRPGPRPGIGELRPVFREKPIAAPAPSVHVIQRGETLFSIAEKYRIAPEMLMEHNGLRTRVLRPGSTLRIPQIP